MRKKIGVLCSIMLCISLLAGCGSASSARNNSMIAETIKSNGKTLVAYYSATGTTKGVAKRIAEITGADLFAIEPVETYSSDDLDWSDKNSRSALLHHQELEKAEIF